MKKFIIVALAASSLFLSGCNKTTPVVNSNVDEFAKCLTTAGVKMYGTDTCPHCQKQKELFGNSFQYINFTDCNANPTACSNAWIDKIPTWEFKDGTKEVWEKTFADLSLKSNCALPE